MTQVVRREARHGAPRPGRWRRWNSYTAVFRACCLLIALVVTAWCAEGVYIVITGHTTPFETWRKGNAGFDALIRFVGPVLTAGIASAAFLFCWYGWTKRRYLAKARRRPHELVPTAGPDTAEIVGRQEVAQVIAERLRDRATRRPYLLVGGLGTGKTAVLVRLTEMLARQGAVPVPVRLRDTADQGELDFEKLARRRFAEEAPQGILARSKNERVWQQLLADDKPVVIADGLEEAVLGERFQDDRDNIIRRAIERAHEERLPLVIASRPHTPLEGTHAAIIELEPLSEEEALHFVEDRAAESDERRLDWIVETAEATESPLYLQIARELHRHHSLERDRPRNDPHRLDTRSWDRSTLRLWLLETWYHALVEGRLREHVGLPARERRDTLEAVSALACAGLLQDKLEVGFADLLDRDVHPGPVRRAGATAGHLWAGRRFDRYGKRGDAFSEWHRERLWDALREGLGDDERRQLTTGNTGQCQAALARAVNRADALGLVEGFERKVRFPHSVIQAYLGFRLLARLGERRAGALVQQALSPPGPSRELLIALVLLSRARAAELAGTGGGLAADVRRDLHELWRRSPLSGRSLAGQLSAAADRRTDPKALDLYAAALEMDAVEGEPRLLHTVTATLNRRWQDVRGNGRTLEEAKLGLVKQLGAALRAAAGKTDTTPLYEQLFELARQEPSHAVRLAAAQEFGDGGDAAFAVIRRRVGVDSDPVEEYRSRVGALKAERRRAYDAWAAAARGVPAGRGSDAAARDRLDRERQAVHRRYRRQRVELVREFVIRAWMVPMLLGSVSDGHRDEARYRLVKWMRHLDPRHTGGSPDLPLVLENALAQGFKYAANRRKRHPLAYEGGRSELIRHAETVLQQSRCWYAQLTLVQALCLWKLPDSIARDGTEADVAADPECGDDDGGPPAARPTTAVQTVRRWLSMAGTPEGADGAGGPADGAAGRRVLHPFVAEAGDLAALALETRRPERFLWIDEKAVVDTIGSRACAPRHYRKHNLWLPPSVGWSTLDARAQRLVADVLVLTNLIERDGRPDEVEERFRRSRQPGAPLPPCLTQDRRPLHPELTAGTSALPAPGSTCLPTCPFRYCPYPPRGVRPRAELREPFCRQQQALLRGRIRRRSPGAFRRRTPHWAGMRARELHGFWEAMATRSRG
ncbi:ATP-binding protein [Streptomyces sp. URMC 126]|uniref:ATP-binding protein n=1 Tax=Streptomyces sp. URMC 126 TaxID=3423401 RepID=UPI003F1C2850